MTDISGLFVRDQAEALASLESDINVIVSLWGHADSRLTLRQVKMWPKKLQWCITQPNDIISTKNGVHEILNPKLTWSDRFPLGGAGQLIEVNRRNFILAQKKFGKIDLIHAHVSYPAGYISALLAQEFDVPYVVTEHMGPFPFSNLIKKGKPLQEITIALTQSAANIAVSPSLAKRMTDFSYPMPRIIPNVVDERFFSHQKSNSSKHIFFTLCNINDFKGIDHLLKSIALWNPCPKSFEFRIGGTGPMLQAYKKMANQLNISDRVLWLGELNRAQVKKYFNECHIYVMPSRFETFGVVYAEAIASGKPIIATRCGGPEFIVNEKNGLLVEIDDISGLVEAMKKLVKNLNDYKPEVIRCDFEARFSRFAVVKQLRSLYDEVVR
jgi:glycosyltransferase involved in cell wall biosynthesis